MADSCRSWRGCGSGGFLHLPLPWFLWFGQAPDEDVGRCLALHAAALVGSLGMVADQVGVEVGLHGFDAVVELLTPHDAEVLVQQGAVEALDEAVGLRPSHPGGSVLDLLEL